MTVEERAELMAELRTKLEAAQDVCARAHAAVWGRGLPVCAGEEERADPYQNARLFHSAAAQPAHWIGRYVGWLADIGWAPDDPQILPIDDIAAAIEAKELRP